MQSKPLWVILELNPAARDRQPASVMDTRKLEQHGIMGMRHDATRCNKKQALARAHHLPQNVDDLIMGKALSDLERGTTMLVSHRQIRACAWRCASRFLLLEGMLEVSFNIPSCAWRWCFNIPSPRGLLEHIFSCVLVRLYAGAALGCACMCDAIRIPSLVLIGCQHPMRCIG
jgi:hypothetical protein